MQKWYAVMAKTRQEQTSTSFLGQAGIETYYPEVNESFSIKGRRHMRRSGLFPGYFFARFDYAQQYRTISYCRGVRRIVTFGQTPAEVESGLLENIRRRLSQQNMISIPMFAHGEGIRVCHGPLAGVEGVLDSYLSGKERVVVLLRALSYQSRAVVKLSDIERLPEAV